MFKIMFVNWKIREHNKTKINAFDEQKNDNEILFSVVFLNLFIILLCLSSSHIFVSSFRRLYHKVFANAKLVLLRTKSAKWLRHASNYFSNLLVILINNKNIPISIYLLFCFFQLYSYRWWKKYFGIFNFFSFPKFY